MILRYFGIWTLALSLGSCERLNIPSQPAPAQKPIEMMVEEPVSGDSVETEIQNDVEVERESGTDSEREENQPPEDEVLSLNPVADEGLPEAWWNSLDAEEQKRWKIPVKTRRVRLNWGVQGRHLLAYKAQTDGWLVLKPDSEDDLELILEQTNVSLEPLLSNEEYGVMKGRELVVEVAAGQWIFLRVRPSVQLEGEALPQFLSLVKKDRK